MNTTSRTRVAIICIMVCTAGCGLTSYSYENEAHKIDNDITDDNNKADTADELTEETDLKKTENQATEEAVKTVPVDYICGMDASSVLVEENSGVRYYDFTGREQDVFKTLAEAGLDCIRIRVWNDPYDEDGNGYGGGNNDLNTAIILGKRITEYGMQVCIDFHYSDFWADPKRQHAPKAWEGMTNDEKCDALYEYTKTSLTELLEAGVDVTMVQIGNEINNGMAGATFIPDVNDLLISGSKAVRDISQEYDRDIKIIIHYTKVNNKAKIDSAASNLQKAKIDYDIMGLSYYPFWDGTITNMQSVVGMIRDRYEKDVMIVETSYPYTSRDGDGSANSVKGDGDIVMGYLATVDGQKKMVRDVYYAAYEAGAIGSFYWEGTWIPVGPADNDNSSIWEEFGSGWASSYATEYDPEDAGLYYGGCSWDNQAMFDFEGHPLESLNIFKELKAQP